MHGKCFCQKYVQRTAEAGRKGSEVHWVKFLKNTGKKVPESTAENDDSWLVVSAS